MRRGQLAIAGIFFVNGMAFGNWIPRIPQVKQQLALSESQLGLALLGVAAGALTAMPLSGAIAARVGSRPLVRVVVLLYCGALVLPPLATSLWWLAAALAVLGATVGALDVAMNTYGVALERNLGRRMLSSLHGAFSAGFLAGAITGGVAAGFSMLPVTHLAITGTTLAVVAAFAGLALPAVEEHGGSGYSEATLKHDGNRQPRAGRGVAARSRKIFASALRRMLKPLTGGLDRQLVVLSLIAFLAAFAEGAVGDWSGVYLAEHLSAAAGLAAGGFIAFSVAMAVTRLVGDRLIARFGERRILGFGGLVAAASMVGGLASEQTVITVAAFGLVGAGIASAFPVVLSSAGRRKSSSTESGVTTVSTVGYFAFVVGPPLIGFVADQLTLQVALGSIAMAGALIMVLATLRENSQGPKREPGGTPDPSMAEDTGRANDEPIGR